MPNDQREIESRNFEKSIYPIWAKIFQDAKDEESEIALIHKCDMIIFYKAKKPMRFFRSESQNISKMDEIAK